MSITSLDCAITGRNSSIIFRNSRKTPSNSRMIDMNSRKAHPIHGRVCYAGICMGLCIANGAIPKKKLPVSVNVAKEIRLSYNSIVVIPLFPLSACIAPGPNQSGDASPILHTLARHKNSKKLNRIGRRGRILSTVV